MRRLPRFGITTSSRVQRVPGKRLSLVRQRQTGLGATASPTALATSGTEIPTFPQCLTAAEPHEQARRISAKERTVGGSIRFILGRARARRRRWRVVIVYGPRYLLRLVFRRRTRFRVSFGGVLFRRAVVLLMLWLRTGMAGRRMTMNGRPQLDMRKRNRYRQAYLSQSLGRQ